MKKLLCALLSILILLCFASCGSDGNAGKTATPSVFFDVRGEADGSYSIGYYYINDPVIIPERISGHDITCISLEAFQYNDLTAVTMHDNIKVIMPEAFRYCRRLEKVDLGHGVEKIQSMAFASCDALESITIPSSVKEIGSYAFDETAALKTVRFEGNAPKVDYLIFGEPREDLTIYYKSGTTGWDNKYLSQYKLVEE